MKKSLVNALYDKRILAGHPWCTGRAVALHPFAAEVAGARLMRLLGIGAPTEFRLADRAVVALFNERDWVCKPIQGRAKVGALPAPWNVMVRRIPGVISLYSLREIYGVSSSPVWEFEYGWDGLTAVELSARTAATIGQMMMSNGTQRLEDPARFFKGFEPPSDWTTITGAIRWDGEQRLLISAARLFLGCSASHPGNLMVDNSGQLYSIDHEYVQATNFADIRLLAENLKPGATAYHAVEQVATLSEADVDGLFDGMPDGVSWPLGEPRTRQYFANRLDLWKSYFGR